MLKPNQSSFCQKASETKMFDYGTQDIMTLITNLLKTLDTIIKKKMFTTSYFLFQDIDIVGNIASQHYLSNNLHHQICIPGCYLYHHTIRHQSN